MPRQQQDAANGSRSPRDDSPTDRETSASAVERLVRRAADRAAAASRAERRGEVNPTVALALDKALEALRRRIEIADERD